MDHFAGLDVSVKGRGLDLDQCLTRRARPCRYASTPSTDAALNLKSRTRSYLMQRFLLVSLCALTLLSTIGINSASADRYCLQGRQWGYPGNCHFHTLGACRASASGTDSSCGVNPRYAHQHRGH
jgi:hypothetical protein